MKIHVQTPSRVLALFVVVTLGVMMCMSSSAAAYVRRVNVGYVAGGTVTATGINCGSDCYEDTSDGTSFTLTATPDSGRTFVKWYVDGATCAGGVTNPVCTFTVGAGDVWMSAEWGYPSYTVNYTKQGDGSGTVTGAGTYANGASVTLTATPASGSKFEGWIGGRCGTSKGATVSLDPVCTFTIGSVVQSYNEVVKFTKVSSAASPSPSPTPSTPSPAPAPTTASPTTEASALLSELTLNDQPLTSTTDSEKPVVTQNYIVLSGKTTPLATVKLYIHSTPREATVKADAQGVWTTKISNLENGNHRVEAEVIDPSSGQVSTRTQIAAFTVNAKLATPGATSAASKGNGVLWIVLGGVAAAALAGCAWWYFKFKYHKQQPTPPPATE